MKRSYTHLAARLFNVPLLISRAKLDAILAALGPKLGVQVETPQPEAFGPGDKGRDRKPYYVAEDGVAVIEVIGPLVKRDSGEFLSGGPTTYAAIESEFTDAATDPNVTGILLLVDSPGGEFNGALELSDLIYSQRKSKPIFAAVDGDAYSAGYAIASSATELFLSRSGGVGSVGVWMAHVDQSGANEKAGLKITYISAGAHKLDGNPDAPLTDQAHQVFKDIVDGAAQMFVASIARNRGLPEGTVRGTEAGMFFAEPKAGIKNAVEMRFADKVGTVADAMAALRDRIALTRNGAAQRSAPNSKGGNLKPGETADTQKPPVEQPGNPAPAAPPAAAPGEPAIASGFAHAKTIIEQCALAGLTAVQALPFLKPEATTEQVREELLATRAANGGREIFPHILPHAGAMPPDNYRKDDSPVERACKAIAEARGGN